MGTAALVPSRGSCELPESSKESASEFVAALELPPEKVSLAPTPFRPSASPRDLILLSGVVLAESACLSGPPE